nr:hypothetical protein [uncultured Flavobacterium sp.]
MSKELDRLLYRPVKPAGAFEGKFPPSDRTAVYLGSGMTDFSMKSMAALVYQYYQQAANVAPMLEGETLQDTCEEIHYFLYNWFQYMSDDEMQRLRTPAASWAQRYEGIDCKSYSILASCILSCLGITHYLRRIKQPAVAPDQWTHVYVVVPVNQETAALNKGYYVIDGTVPTTKECEYVEKDDLFMSMEHYALNAPAPHALNAGVDFTKLKNMMFPNGISFSSLSCIGGTYDSKDLNALIDVVNPWFVQAYENVNSAIAGNSPQLITVINTLITATYGMADHARLTAAKSWSSSCSKSATAGYKAVADYYSNLLQKAFFPWIQEFFTVSYSSVTKLNTSFPFETKPSRGFKKNEFSQNVTFNQLASIRLKADTTSITRFTLTQYVLDANNYTNGTFNADTMLNGFTEILATYATTPPAGSNNTGNTNTGNSNNSGSGYVAEDDDEDTNKPDNGSTNTALIVVGGAAALMIGAKLLFFSGGTGLGKPNKKSK